MSTYTAAALRERPPADLDTALAALGNRESRKIGNNTYLHKIDDGTVGIRLHQTDVVTLTADGITLDTGGWYTVTTKSRINDVLRRVDHAVYSDRGRWYLYGPDRSKVAPFADGMTLHLDGTIEGQLAQDTVRKADAQAARDRKDVNNWLRRTTAQQIVDAFDNPGGDCLLCRFGDTDADHLRGHVDESYVMLTLTRNAVRERNYYSPDTIIGMIYHDAKAGVVSRDYTGILRKYLIRHIVGSQEGRASK